MAAGLAFSSCCRGSGNGGSNGIPSNGLNQAGPVGAGVIEGIHYAVKLGIPIESG